MGVGIRETALMKLDHLAICNSEFDIRCTPENLDKTSYDARRLIVSRPSNLESFVRSIWITRLTSPLPLVSRITIFSL